MLVVGIGGYMVWRAKQDVAEPVAEPVAVSPTPTADLTPAPPEPASPPPIAVPAAEPLPALADSDDDVLRSEEHTSGLQSLMRISYAVFRLQKKKKKISEPQHTKQ